MPLLLSLIAGLVVWLVLWAIDIKAIDAFMITVVLLIVAAGVQFLAPHLPGSRAEE